MAEFDREVQGLLLDSIALDRARADEGPDDLWAMTLKAGADEKVYLLNSEHLRLLAEAIFNRTAS
jgi:hypothetical protein